MQFFSFWLAFWHFQTDNKNCTHQQLFFISNPFGLATKRPSTVQHVAVLDVLDGYGKFNAHFLCSTCLCVYVFTFYLCIADIFSFIYVKGDHFGILYKTEHQVKMLNKNSKKLFHSMYSKYSFFFCALVVECLSLLAVTLNKLK